MDLVAAGNGFDTSVEPNTLMSCAWINVPTRSSVEAGTGNVYLNKHRCPVGFDAYNANLGQLAAACGETMNGIVFALGRTLPGDWVLQATGSVSPTGVAWTDVPAGPITITEDVPTGYGEPIVYCQEAPEGQDGVLTLVEFTPTVEVARELRAGYDLHCEWFNVPTAAGDDNGVVEVNKHVCPVGFDAENADLGRLGATCQEEPRDGYLFTFFRNDAPQSEQRTGDRAPGAVRFGLGEAPARFAVRETVPEGFGRPIVYCSQVFANGGASRAERMDVSAASAIGLQLNAGDKVFCDWFNVPEEAPVGEGAGEDEPLEPAEETTGEAERVSIEIAKFACPAADVDPYAAELERLREVCREPMDGVHFALDRGRSDIVLLQRTGELVPSAVVWPNLAPDRFTIEEKLPEGYGEPVVFCTLRLGDQTEGPGRVRPEVPGQFSVTLGAGQAFACDWFNVPIVKEETGQPLPGAVYVGVRACQPFIDEALLDRYDALLDRCPSGLDGVAFHLTGDADQTLAQRTGELFPSMVGWGGIAAGPVAVRETLPESVGEAVVFCTGFPAGGAEPEQFRATVLDGAIAYELRGGETLYCDWFNLPAYEIRDGLRLGHGRAITYVCPVGVAIDPNDVRGLYSTCTGELDRVEFRLSYGAEGVTQTQATGGPTGRSVGWYGVVPGLVEITAALPADYQEAVVQCGQDGQEERVAVQDGGIAFELRPNDEFACRWFLIPAGDPGEESTGLPSKHHSTLATASEPAFRGVAPPSTGAGAQRAG
jgi:hypothetical protein